MPPNENCGVWAGNSDNTVMEMQTPDAMARLTVFVQLHRDLKYHLLFQQVSLTRFISSDFYSIPCTFEVVTYFQLI